MEIGFPPLIGKKLMEKLTFEQLPEAMALLLEKISRVEELLSAGGSAPVYVKEMLSAGEAAEFLDLSMSSLYKMTHKNELPYYKPGGSKLYFKRDELVTWMMQHRVMSKADIEQEAINYVISKKRRADRFR